VQNKGIAHSLVPEQRDFYEAWVDFAVRDSAGKVLAESGFLQPDGSLDPSAHSFTNRLINNKGELNDLHQIWRNRVLAYNNALQSGRSQLVRYRFRLPKNIAGSVSLTATVRYRRFNQHFIDYAMDQKHYPLPIVDMASATTTLNIGENSKRSPSAQDEWMRWNNYGIALLDAQQYAASVHAFERVAALRPDYADAFTTWLWLKSPGSATATPNPISPRLLPSCPPTARPLLSRPRRAQRRPGQGSHRRPRSRPGQVPPRQGRPPRAGLLLLPGARLPFSPQRL